MSRSRKVVVLVVVAILALPWVSAAGPREEEVRTEISVSEVLGRLWGLVMSVWSEGGFMDPDGGTMPETQPPIGVDDGCRIDPSGCSG